MPTTINKNLPHPDLRLIFVQGGKFMMGDDTSEYSDEQPAHPVQMSDFNICQYPVTQDLYEWVMKKNPSHFKGKRRPVETVSWDDTQLFIEKLNKKVKEFQFRLPTEAEWEYAARGGVYSAGYTYAGSDSLRQVGWYRDNSNRETKAVGLLRPNELGLYDMSGNVWEWCEDDWHSNYKSAPNDGSAWKGGEERGADRILRGGPYFFGAVRCRLSFRDRLQPGDRYDNIGFRLVCSLQSVG